MDTELDLDDVEEILYWSLIIFKFGKFLFEWWWLISKTIWLCSLFFVGGRELHAKYISGIVMMGVMRTGVTELRLFSPVITYIAYEIIMTMFDYYDNHLFNSIY
jgi:hypothetical protein